METIQTANVALRFLLELSAILAFGYWGFHTGQSLLSKIGLGIGIPLLIVVIWAMFIAPNAVVHLSEPVPFVLGLVLLLMSALALATAGQITLAVLFGAIIVINALLMLIWRQ